ncbi:hypothetical protein Cgig2_004626 [Carnegiea gigantea]|uniref:Lipid desaturase domain-containing protein n=1 Tax=Carnegiea gigantea TaxID=171969 RepID=A0A9Q1Q9X7_9CARY|nr:hypothetical protein Cgig2_004626 [Carnegiea gigantea]
MVLPLDLLVHDPTQLTFIGSFSGCVMFSQQFHAWAHSTKSKLPKIVVVSQHADHHKPPYNSNYCIVSGVWNNFWIQIKILRFLKWWCSSNSVFGLGLGVSLAWSGPRRTPPPLHESPVLQNSGSTHLNTYIVTQVYCAGMAPTEPKPSTTRLVVDPSPPRWRQPKSRPVKHQS